MWLFRVAVLAAVVVTLHDGAAYSEYQDTEDDDSDDADFVDQYDAEDIIAATPVTALDESTRSRVRRDEDQEARTLSVDEIREVKGAIKQLLAGRQLDLLTTTHATQADGNAATAEDANPVTKHPAFTGLTKTDYVDPTKFYEDIIEEIIDNAKRQGLLIPTRKANTDVNGESNDIQVERETIKTRPRPKPTLTKANPERIIDMALPQELLDYVKSSRTSGVSKPGRTPGVAKPGRTPGVGKPGRTPVVSKPGRSPSVAKLGRTPGVGKPERMPPTTFPPIYFTYTEDTTKLSEPKLTSKQHTTTEVVPDATRYPPSTPPPLYDSADTTKLSEPMLTSKQHATTEIVLTEPTTTIVTTSTRRRTRRRRTTTTVATTTTTPQPDFDIPALVDLIANLTYDFESNITLLFNKTLQKYNIPTCKPPEPSTTEYVNFDLVNATVVAKCFVCGMHVEGIPASAHCSDAFASDVLPLVPVDQQAKMKIRMFRKYCRYMDVNGFYENETEPRSVYGRFTGGCSVRWIDLSGVYTQRACRNKRRAMTGRHFGSKRMAKLEMALNDVENGCITSPMSTLVPLSRGISLFARFHACVCTGNWCNITSVTKPWIACIAMLTLWTATATLLTSTII